ncbi:MAG: hypothetical protein K9N49_10630, partial [Candidatus Marinimicrobia bacterium]|nr:hypothetical protein [Candidatus Neomarinimicrobiota bacterium]
MMERVILMNQSDDALKSIWQPEGVARAQALDLDIQPNREARALSDAEWAERIADARAVITTWGSPRLDAAVLARDRDLRNMAHAPRSGGPPV